MSARLLRLQTSHAAALKEFLETPGELPWPGMRQASERLRRGVLSWQMRQHLELPAAQALTLAAVAPSTAGAAAAPEIEGLAQVRLLEWDTGVLSTGCGRVDALRARGSYTQQRATLAEVLPPALAWLRDHGVRLVHARLPILARAAIHTLEEAGFRFMTCLACFYRAPGSFSAAWTRSLAQRFQVRRGRRGDLPHLQTMALGAFQQNRFSLDARLDAGRVDRLYAAWISGALQRRQNRLLVCEQQKKPIAFLLYEVQRFTVGRERLRLGRLVLAASATAERSRGAALACLLRCMEEQQGQVDVLEAVVGTTNDAACRALRRFGFHCLNTLIDLHAWL
ncbi:MAG: hypothetical protein HYY96_05280 [Candidatus Tectomicrobia bacterium]|nr:hypothetical protein [Candidatus Tectomicrobia bacterium]